MGFHPRSFTPDGGGANHHAVVVGFEFADKGLVDFQLVKRQSRQIGQRRVTGTKVVQREADAGLFEYQHFGDGVFDVLQQQAFGNFQLELLRRCASARYIRESSPQRNPTAANIRFRVIQFHDLRSDQPTFVGAPSCPREPARKVRASHIVDERAWFAGL